MLRNGFAALVEEASVSVSYAPIVCRDKQALQEGTGQSIEIRQSKYLNNFVEQGHRAIKRISTDARLQSFSSGRNHFAKH
jgi:transposase-like protein